MEPRRHIYSGRHARQGCWSPKLGRKLPEWQEFSVIPLPWKSQEGVRQPPNNRTPLPYSDVFWRATRQENLAVRKCLCNGGCHGREAEVRLGRSLSTPETPPRASNFKLQGCKFTARGKGAPSETSLLGRPGLNPQRVRLLARPQFRGNVTTRRATVGPLDRRRLCNLLLQRDGGR